MRLLSLFSMSILLLCVCPALTVQADAVETPPFPGVAKGETEIISLDKRNLSADKATISVLSADESGLVLEFDLPEIGIQALDIAGETYHAVEIAGGAYRGEEGSPMLPTFSRFIQVPDRVGVTFDIQTVEMTELTGYRPVPMQGADNTDFVLNEDAYAQIGYDNTERITVGEPAIARDLRLVPLTFNPVRYDPAQGTMEVVSKVQVRINFAGEDLRNAAPLQHSLIPESFHNLYKDIVVNYGGPRDDQTVGLGMYVIICPNNTTVINKLQPLIEWRERKGYDVYLATTAETGSSKENIKSWLMTQYNAWDNPPEYVALVGDVSGSVVIPTWHESWSGYSGEGDHPYAELAGGDVLADVHIGRISVSSTSELELYVNKIVGYESNPYMTQTSWYKRGTLVGDPDQSGYTCLQIMQWLKTQLLDVGYAEVDTVFTSPWLSRMVSSLNDGCSVFGFRGYYWVQGLDPGQISNLQNGKKMTFAVLLTCDTGSFDSGSCRSEAFIRCGAPPNTPSGGIAAIGTSTIHTHTRFNNCVTYGIWQGALYENPEFGAAFTRGLYELYLNYAAYDMTDVRIFSHWNNLMGDPAGVLWTDIPQTIAASYPADIAVGTNSVTVSVTKGGVPLENAYVCLKKDDDNTHARGYTNTNGEIELHINDATVGDLLVTVTKHNCKPILNTIDVSQETRFVSYFAHTLDGDGAANPNESLALDVQVKNFGTSSASSVNGIISSSDSYVNITDSSESFGTVAAGGTAWSAGDFNFQIAGDAPSGHIIQIGLDATSGGDTWHSVIEIPVVAASFEYANQVVYDVGSRLDPGEAGELAVDISNFGNASGTSVTGVLSTTSEWVTITDDSGSYGTINTGSHAMNSSDRFGVSTAADCYPGHLAQMELDLTFSNGATDKVLFELPVGEASTNTPTGPDAYGYYAYDNTDTAYPEAPNGISFVEIASNYGGPGSSVGLGDFGTAQDDSKTVTLPFAFTYYGETFTRATICSNGWMSMGSTYLTNYRNWTIPCIGAPPNMIAPMWDNFYQSSSDQVYHYFDAANHRYIIQWSRLKNAYNSSARSNFEVMLYDPAHYSTETGDGIIIFAYEDFNNVDALQHYSTVGIQNADNSTGVLYSYWNTYNSGAAPINDTRVIKFVPRSTFPRGTFSGHVANATDGNADLPNAQIRMVETGQTLVTDANGNFGSAVQTGLYTVECSHAGFTTETIYNVSIVEDQTTVRNFALDDIAGPVFSGTTVLDNTIDTAGPYDISTYVAEYSTVEELSLYYNIGQGWQSTPLVPDNGQYRASIPGAPYTTLVQYYLYGRDIGDLEGFDPLEGQSEPYTFWVMPPVLADDVEDGIGDWTHESLEGGYIDQWHRSSARNHTSGGSYSWKAGGSGTSDYDGKNYGALISPVFELESEATFTFWHRMNAEQNNSNPSRGYDGGYIEQRVDGGNWEHVTPVSGGYTHTTQVGADSPFSADIPFYSGTFDWKETTIIFGEEDLGSVQIRFVFGSDDNTNFEGWYVDDFFILADAPGLSDTEDHDQMPAQLQLYQNHPNPFSAASAATQIRFDLPRSATVSLKIVDTSGRLVRTLVSQSMTAGAHLVSWNGRDEADRLVGSGVYFYVLDSPGIHEAKQMLILK